METDPTAFYSYDEYRTAVDTLHQVVKLRGQSIQGQLDGTIPSTAEEQRSSDALIDASTLEISVMGSMNTGGGGFDFDRQSASADVENMAGLPEAADIARDAGADSGLFETDETPPEGDAPAEDSSGKRPFRDEAPGGSPDGAQAVSVENGILYGAALLVLIVAMLFAILYRRRPNRR